MTDGQAELIRYRLSRAKETLEEANELVNSGHLFVDHINHDGLDNRIANLRAATHRQNAYNRIHFRKNPSSKYKGVSFKKRTKKWQAQIRYDSKSKFIGFFDNEIDAAKAYDKAAKKYHGEFAALNFPD